MMEIFDMAQDEIYLTVSREKRQPQNDGYIAIISKGSPQLGDSETTVLTVTLVPNMKAANKWFKAMLVERPWESRN